MQNSLHPCMCQELHLACKNWVMRCWCECVICLERGADCSHMVQLMPLHPETASSLASFKSRLVLPYWYRLTQGLSWKRGCYNGCSVVVVGQASNNADLCTWWLGLPSGSLHCILYILTDVVNSLCLSSYFCSWGKCPWFVCCAGDCIGNSVCWWTGQCVFLYSQSTSHVFLWNIGSRHTLWPCLFNWYASYQNIHPLNVLFLHW